MTSQPPAKSLMQCLAAGEPSAYGTLYDGFGPAMLRVAASMLGSTHDAEDVLQDVFVNLARSRSRFLEVDDLEAYLFASIRYAVMSKLAKRKQEKHHLRQLQLARSEAFEPANEVEDDLSVQLESLPPEQREVIVLKIDAGLTFAQIGTVLGVSLNTAASRYRYAIEKLRQTMEKP